MPELDFAGLRQDAETAFRPQFEVVRRRYRQTGYSAEVTAVHGCVGKYVDVTVIPHKGQQPLRGWSWMPCATQLTTCDRSGSDLDR